MPRKGSKSTKKKKTLSKSRRKRRLKKRILRIAVILAFIIMLLVLGIATTYGIKYIKKHYHNNQTEEKKPNKDKWEDKTYTASLIMVGDALIHSSVYRDANRLANYKGYDFKPQIEYIKEITKDYDLA